MKTSSITLDRVLHHILMEEEVGCFTIMELRDRYLEFVEPNGFSLPDLRVYLYDQIRKMINHGWASYHSEKKPRGQRFIVLDKPERLRLRLIEPGKGMQERISLHQDKTSIADALEQPAETEMLPKKRAEAEALQQMLKEAHLDFLTSYGETERYDHMIREIPGLKSTLEPDRIASRDKSSRLLGHVNALKAALQKLGVM